MHIYRNKESKLLYTINQIIYDISNLNKCSGIIATPYKCKGKILLHQLEDYRTGEIDYFDPEKFVNDNFEVVAEKLNLN